MVKNEQIIFQIDSPEVVNALEKENYKIEFTESKEKNSKLCVIYFSSNEIYYPNTSAAFQDSILKKDKYEWQRNKFPNASKHIFIRDLKKQWYLEGINNEINNPKKLEDFLKKETEGYTIITIGSSAGGFAAILFGSLLENVTRVYSFNGQFNLNQVIKKSNDLTDPILFKIKKDGDWQSYLDLSNFINDRAIYYYFQSCYSKIDMNQYEVLSDNSKNRINIIRFKTSNHGFPFLRINLPYILAFDKKNLDGLVNKSFNLIPFSIRLIGVIPTFQFVVTAIVNRYKKKRIENSFKTQ